MCGSVGTKMVTSGHGVMDRHGSIVCGLQVCDYFKVLLYLVPEVAVYFIHILTLGQPIHGTQKNVAFNFHIPGRWNNEDTNAEREFLCQYIGR